MSDHEALLYAAFGLARASLSGVLSPSILVSGVKAALAGHLPGIPAGDVLLLPGAFLVRGETVSWAHRGTRADDNPDWSTVPELAGAARESA